MRLLKRAYLRQLALCLRFRQAALAVVGLLLLATISMLPSLGGEFMPQLEEGNIYIRGTFPVNISLAEAADKVRLARGLIRGFDEVELVASQTGRPDDGTDPTGYYNAEFHVPLKPHDEWEPVKDESGWRKHLWPRRPRTKTELTEDMKAKLDFFLPGV